MAKALILSGYGINCEKETAYACKLAGFDEKIVHINEIVENKSLLKDYQFLLFPGGFSYGDDTGSGNGLANKIRNNFEEELFDFVERKSTLTMGICNGFQVLINLGLLPYASGDKKAALSFNDNARYTCKWVSIKPIENISPFTNDFSGLDLPVAHGEGKFTADPLTLKNLAENSQIVLKYSENPNGSLDDIAGICSPDGRVFGLMPHPERAIFTTQMPYFRMIVEVKKRYCQKKAIPRYEKGLNFFKNAYKFFK